MNMSYCRFENTESDLRDCVNSIDEDGAPQSKTEREAMHRMYRLCQKFIEQYENFPDGEFDQDSSNLY